MILPYLELPLLIGYGNDEEGNPLPSKTVMARFTPSAITAYHEGYYPEVGTFIYHNQQVFQIEMTVAQLEHSLRAYWDMLGKKQTIKEKLKIIN